MLRGSFCENSSRPRRACSAPIFCRHGQAELGNQAVRQAGMQAGTPHGLRRQQHHHHKREQLMVQEPNSCRKSNYGAACCC